MSTVVASASGWMTQTTWGRCAAPGGRSPPSSARRASASAIRCGVDGVAGLARQRVQRGDQRRAADRVQLEASPHDALGLSVLTDSPRFAHARFSRPASASGSTVWVHSSTRPRNWRRSRSAPSEATGRPVHRRPADTPTARLRGAQPRRPPTRPVQSAVARAAPASAAVTVLTSIAECLPGAGGTPAGAGRGRWVHHPYRSTGRCCSDWARTGCGRRAGPPPRQRRRLLEGRRHQRSCLAIRLGRRATGRP